MMNTKMMIATAGLLMMATGAMADTISAKFEGTGRGTNLKATLDNSGVNVFVGSLRYTLTNGSGVGVALNGAHRTFCADLLQTVSTSATTHQVVQASVLTNAISATNGAARASALADVFAIYGTQATDSAADNNFAAAFQLIVWDIIYDYTSAGVSSLSLTGGRFVATQTNGSALSSAVTTAYNTIKSAIGPAYTSNGLFAITSGQFQDQLVQVQTLIPTPGAAALAGVGLLAVGRRRRVK